MSGDSWDDYQGTALARGMAASGAPRLDRDPKLIADALSAAACDSGDVSTQRAWLAARHSPYGAPGVGDALVMAAFIAHCCIMLRKLATQAVERPAMTEPELREWLGLIDSDDVPREVVAAMSDIPVPSTDAEQLAAFRAYLSAVPLAPGAVMTGEVTRHGPEVEWPPAEAGAAVAAALDEVGPAPGLWSPPDSSGAEIFHSPACKCRHKKVLHAGADADGRCVNRSCGCGRYTPAL